MKNALSRVSFIFLFCIAVVKGWSQDNRTQYHGLLKDSYFSVNFGYINTPYSTKQIEPGFTARVTNYHFGMRLILFGHQFNKYLSAQISYMKPLQYAVFDQINGTSFKHSVWLHSGTLTLRPQLPLSRRSTIFGEAGLGIFTRRGFTDANDVPVVKDASFGTYLLGAGWQYRINRKWDLLLGFAYGPGKPKYAEPSTTFYSAGFKYNLIPLPEEKVKRNADGKYSFPKNLLQVGYATNNAVGYWPNNFFSKKVAIFWGGGIEVDKGLLVHYQRNVFHTHKVFAFDIGASTGFWTSNEKKEHFYTLSVFPLFRFNVIRRTNADFYLFYSAAGPSYISKTVIDDKDAGRHFTFQDMMGMGTYFTKKKNLNAEIHINHYSNGNIFESNRGVKIPLTFHIGYAF